MGTGTLKVKKSESMSKSQDKRYEGGSASKITASPYSKNLSLARDHAGRVRRPYYGNLLKILHPCNLKKKKSGAVKTNLT